MKMHYEDAELDREKTIELLVKEVANWDMDRLIDYARQCVERDLKLMTSDGLVDYWVSEMDSDLVPKYTYKNNVDSSDKVADGADAPLYELHKHAHKRAS